MAEQYYRDLDEGIIGVEGPHEEFDAISEMRSLPREQFASFILHAIYSERCDLIRHWVACGLEPESTVWLDRLAEYYRPSLLDVLPLLLETRPLSLTAAKKLLTRVELRPYLANYLHQFSIRRLIVNHDLGLAQFLDKLFDLSDPALLQIVMYDTQHSRALVEFLYERCADPEYRTHEQPYVTINEAVASLRIGTCLPTEAQSILDAMPEEFRPTLRAILFDNAPFRGMRCNNTLKLAHELLAYKGPYLAVIMIDMIVALFGTLCMTERERKAVTPWPFSWRLRHDPESVKVEEVQYQTRSQLLCAYAFRRFANRHADAIFAELSRR